MKKNNALIFLASVGSLMLSSCLCGWNGPLPNGKGDEVSMAASSSVPLSSEEQSGPKDELIGQGADLEQDVEGNRVFRIEEFTEPFKLCKTTTSTLDTLKYGDVIISSNLYVAPQFAASDINGDGYRELVFLEKTEDRNRSFVVYDVKNSNILFKQADLTVEKHSHYASYRYSYDVRNGRLTFLPYLGNFSENSIVDYGHLKWSEEKGCYFEWENILGIEKIEFVRFFLNDENMTPVLPSNPGNVYTFETSKQYYMEFKITRNKTDRELDDMLLEVVWGNDNPSHFGEIRSPWNRSPVQNDVAKGQYYYYFTVVNPCEERVWDWYLTDYGFQINYKVVE